MTENEIGAIVVTTAINVHKELGPGLLERVYQIVLAYELARQGLDVRREVAVPLNYKGIAFDAAFYADIIVNEKVILELKSVEKLNPAHFKQLQTYLKLSNIHLGYLLNFGQPLMVNGIRRIVNNLPEE